MQDLENNMDDLFQRAAENYPLKTGKGDWESVAKKIEIKEDDKEVAVLLNFKKSKRIIIIFTILFLLLAGGFMLYIFMPGTSKGSHTIYFSTTNNNKPNGPKVNDNKPVIPSGKQNPYLFFSKEKIERNNNTEPSNNNISANTKTTIYNTSFYSENEVNISKKNAQADNTIIKISDNGNIGFSSNLNSNGKTIKDITENLKADNEEISHQPKKEIEELKDKKNENNNPVNAKKNIKKISAYQKKKGLYAGVLTGPDFSKVESSSFDNTGFDAGLLLGFRLNKAFSFESGIIWNKKKYSSDGKNFSMDKVGSTMPSGMEINTLESNSSLIEVPIKAKYDFIRKTNADLFISGGVSSYIMTKEKNMYNVTINGSQEKFLGVYEKYNYRLPAVVNLSIGYEHKVLRTLNIRIEPFLKIPLQGIGVGSLPVTSAGVQIGITGPLK